MLRTQQSGAKHACTQGMASHDKQWCRYGRTGKSGSISMHVKRNITGFLRSHAHVAR